jgi:RNA-directed DNA polymerase
LGSSHTIRHARILAKVARRISDGEALAMVKQFLKSTGKQGIRKGRPCRRSSQTWR